MWEWLTNLFSGTPEQKRTNTTFTKPNIDQKAVSLITPIPEMVRTFNQARTLPGNDWKSVSNTLFGDGETTTNARRSQAANAARDAANAEPSFVDYTAEDLSSAREYAGRNLINTSQMNDQAIVDIWARDAKGKAAKAAAAPISFPEPDSKTTAVDTVSPLAFGNASEEVRELTQDEWAALTPIQQRAVAGNYALFESRDDPERQSELFQLLGMDFSDRGNVEIGGYASYDDILKLSDYAENRAELPAQMDAVGIGLGGSTPASKSPEMPNMDSLVALANSVYNTGQYEDEDERPSFTFGSSKPILDEGLGEFDSLTGQFTEAHAKWLDENLLPFLADDDNINAVFGNQGYLDALYADINANLAGLSKEQIAGYLESAGDALGIPRINGRLYAIGLLEG